MLDFFLMLLGFFSGSADVQQPKPTPQLPKPKPGLPPD